MCVCLSVLVVSCSAPYIIEAGSVGFDKKDFDDKNQQLHLSGGLIDGFHVIYAISTTKHANDIIIEMQITLTRKSLLRRGMTGDFDFYVPVPPDARRVVFGTERKVIWERPSQ